MKTRSKKKSAVCAEPGGGGALGDGAPLTAAATSRDEDSIADPREIDAWHASHVHRAAAAAAMDRVDDGDSLSWTVAGHT